MPTPLYHQIFLILRDQILSGELGTGVQVPGEEELARQFKVSRITARRSLAELEAEGLVTRSRGRGTHVSGRQEPSPVRGGVEGLLENLIAMGLKTQVALLEFDYVQAPPDVAAALKVLPGAEVQRSVRVRKFDTGPFSYLTTYVPAEIGRTFGRKDLAHAPLLSLLEKSGAEIDRAEQTMSATLADTRVAPLLDTSVGAPLLRISRVVYDSRDRAVEYIIALYRPDRYQFRMSLERVHGAHSNTWSASVAPANGRMPVSTRFTKREKRK